MRLGMNVCVLIAACILLPTLTEAGKKVFCYYSSFAQNRQGQGKFLPKDIDPFLCTHVIFAFVDIDRHGTDLTAFNRNDAGPSGLYERTIALKQHNPDLKVLLAVGGWQIGSKPFIPMVRDLDNMRRWIKNVIKYLRKHKFDGFDMDWEFPATRGSPPEDKYRYTKLMKGLYEAFAEESRVTGREKLLLTMATASGTYFINTSYEPRKIIPYMDFMLLMTYNYHGQWEKRTGHHSPLWKHRNDPPGEQSELYQNWSIDYWLDLGLPKDKLVVGLATYGMSYTLADPEQNGVHSPAKGGGRMGKYTKETGILSYYEICQNILHDGWQTGWIEDQDVPYAYGGDQWVGFDNADSIKMKANNIVKRGLAGAFVWSVEMDDFSGVCGQGKYPLLSTVTQVLKPYHGVAKAAPAETRPKRPNPAVRRTTSTTAKPSLSKGKRVTNWAKPTFRPWNTKSTKAPWWKLANQNIQRKRKTSPQSPAPTLPTNHWENSVEEDYSDSEWEESAHDEWSEDQWEDSVEDDSDDDQWENAIQEKSDEDNQWKESVFDKHGDKRYRSQASSAGAKSEGDVSCEHLGAGLFPHPDNCEKFIMCVSGIWNSYRPHVMSCPAGTRFDDSIKICNHATSVECY